MLLAALFAIFVIYISIFVQKNDNSTTVLQSEERKRQIAEETIGLSSIEEESPIEDRVEQTEYELNELRKQLHDALVAKQQLEQKLTDFIQKEGDSNQKNEQKMGHLNHQFQLTLYNLTLLKDQLRQANEAKIMADDQLAKLNTEHDQKSREAKQLAEQLQQVIDELKELKTNKDQTSAHFKHLTQQLNQAIADKEHALSESNRIRQGVQDLHIQQQQQFQHMSHELDVAKRMLKDTQQELRTAIEEKNKIVTESGNQSATLPTPDQIKQFTEQIKELEQAKTSYTATIRDLQRRLTQKHDLDETKMVHELDQTRQRISKAELTIQTLEFELDTTQRALILSESNYRSLERDYNLLKTKFQAFVDKNEIKVQPPSKNENNMKRWKVLTQNAPRRLSLDSWTRKRDQEEKKIATLVEEIQMLEKRARDFEQHKELIKQDLDRSRKFWAPREKESRAEHDKRIEQVKELDKNIAELETQIQARQTNWEKLQQLNKAQKQQYAETFERKIPAKRRRASDGKDPLQKKNVHETHQEAYSYLKSRTEGLDRMLLSLSQLTSTYAKNQNEFEKMQAHWKYTHPGWDSGDVVVNMNQLH